MDALDAFHAEVLHELNTWDRKLGTLLGIKFRQ